MSDPALPSIRSHFSALQDPRQSAKVLYPLPEILLLMLCATISGADDVVEIGLSGNGAQDFPRRLSIGTASQLLNVRRKVTTASWRSPTSASKRSPASSRSIRPILIRSSRRPARNDVAPAYMA